MRDDESLLSLVDSLLARGASRVTIGDVQVEFGPRFAPAEDEPTTTQAELERRLDAFRLDHYGR
jgi:hypothetical protein